MNSKCEGVKHAQKSCLADFVLDQVMGHCQQYPTHYHHHDIHVSIEDEETCVSRALESPCHCLCVKKRTNSMILLFNVLRH